MTVVANQETDRTPARGAEDVQPLSSVQAGSTVVVVSVEAGGGLRGRLAALGMAPGMKIHVINNSPWGPFIVSVKGSRVILGRGMTDKLLVSHVAD
jgi:Fe2+ transport system protein FeoA